VPPGSRVAAVEKVLQRGEVSRRLVHVNSEPGSPHCGATPGGGQAPSMHVRKEGRGLRRGARSNEPSA
jgi:hypothetical protein